MRSSSSPATAGAAETFDQSHARFARVLAAQGAKVALAARRKDRLDALADKIKAAGGKALAVQMDATDAGSIVAAVAAGEAAFGTIDILVNNAGMPDAQPRPVEIGSDMGRQ